jgi:hypothetical protein
VLLAKFHGVAALAAGTQQHLESDPLLGAAETDLAVQRKSTEARRQQAGGSSVARPVSN